MTEKQIDLDPREYRAKPNGEKAPFFGQGAAPMLAYAIAFVIVALAIRYFR